MFNGTNSDDIGLDKETIFSLVKEACVGGQLETLKYMLDICREHGIDLDEGFIEKYIAISENLNYQDISDALKIYRQEIQFKTIFHDQEDSLLMNFEPIQESRGMNAFENLDFGNFSPTMEEEKQDETDISISSVLRKAYEDEKSKSTTKREIGDKMLDFVIEQHVYEAFTEQEGMEVGIERPSTALDVNLERSSKIERKKEVLTSKQNHHELVKAVKKGDMKIVSDILSSMKFQPGPIIFHPEINESLYIAAANGNKRMTNWILNFMELKPVKISPEIGELTVVLASKGEKDILSKMLSLYSDNPAFRIEDVSPDELLSGAIESNELDTVLEAIDFLIRTNLYVCDDKLKDLFDASISLESLDFAKLLIKYKMITLEYEERDPNVNNRGVLTNVKNQLEKNIVFIEKMNTQMLDAEYVDDFYIVLEDRKNSEMNLMECIVDILDGKDLTIKGTANKVQGTGNVDFTDFLRELQSMVKTAMIDRGVRNDAIISNMSDRSAQNQKGNDEKSFSV